MDLVPVSLREANEFVIRHHRHHKRSAGHKFSLGVMDSRGELRGVAIVGRPVSIALDDKFTMEVARLCTDGFPNACSFLYAAAWRASKALGYAGIQTYILDTESGVSLKAAGWVKVAGTSGGSWNRPKSGRLREDKHPTCKKSRWVPRECVGVEFELNLLSK